MIDGVVSPVTIAADKLAFLKTHLFNMDETQILTSNRGEKGGPRATTLSNPNLPQGVSPEISDEKHTTMVLTVTSLSVLPPTFIFTTKKQNPEEYEVRPLLCAPYHFLLTSNNLCQCLHLPFNRLHLHAAITSPFSRVASATRR